MLQPEIAKIKGSSSLIHMTGEITGPFEELNPKSWQRPCSTFTEGKQPESKQLHFLPSTESLASANIMRNVLIWGMV